MAMPLETLAMLGVSNLLIAATAGSVNADFYPGQFVLVKSRSEERLSADVRARRDALERDLAAVRQRKGKLAEDQYLASIEPILSRRRKNVEVEGILEGSGGMDHVRWNVKDIAAIENDFLTIHFEFQGAA